MSESRNAPLHCHRGQVDFSPRTLGLLPWVLVVAPLVVAPGLADFARLPQQVFIQVCAVVLVLVWAADATGSRVDGSGMRSLDVPLGAFLALSALSLASGPDRSAGLGTLGHWTSCAVVYWLVSRLVRKPSQARPVMAGLFCGGVVVALVGLAQAVAHLDIVPSAAGPAGTLANRNAAAGYLVVVLPLALTLWAHGRRAARHAVVLGCAVVLAFLPATLARVAAAALAVQLLVVWRLHATSSRRRASDGLQALGADWGWTLAVGAVVLLGSGVWLTTVNAEKARSLSIRATLAQSALAMGAERPVLGIGLGRFGDAYPRFGEPIRASADPSPLRVGSAHNEPLQVLAETGLPGFFALVWVAGAAFATLRRLHRSSDPERRAVATALTLSLVGFAVDALVGFPLRTAVGPLALATLLGLIAALDIPPVLRAASRAEDGSRRGAWATRAPAALALSLLPAMAWAVRLQESTTLPPTSVSEPDPCPSAVNIVVREEDHVDLGVEDAPLADVLGCLADRTGLRLEIDGSPPAQRVSATFQDEPLAKVVTELLAGLGIDYLMGFDPTGVRLERLLLVEESRSTSPPRRSSARPGTVRGPVVPGRPRPTPFRTGVDSNAAWADPPRGAPRGTSGVEGEPFDSYRPPEEKGGSESDDPASRPELSPMTLRSGNRKGRGA